MADVQVRFDYSDGTYTMLRVENKQDWHQTTYITASMWEKWQQHCKDSADWQRTISLFAEAAEK